jgi:hypothetical protein
MQISLSFNPAEDKREHVASVVDAVYGVKTSPKQTAVADAPVTAQPTAVAEPLQPSQVNAPALVAEFPNPSIAPTQVASVTPVTSSPVGVDLDKNGIPWDARIHSGGVNDDGTHKKNKDGSWAKKKGVDDLTISTITKELQNLMAAQIGHAAPPAGLPAGGVLGNPVNVPHQVAVPLPTDPNAFIAQPINPAPVTQEAAPTLAPNIAPMPMSDAPQLAPNVAPMPVPMPAPAAAPTDYPSLAVWLAPNLEESGGKLKREHVEHFCAQCGIVNAQGVGDFSLVAQRPDAVAWLHQAFTAQLAAM